MSIHFGGKLWFGHAIAPHGYTQLQLGDHIIFSASAEESAYFRRKLQRRNE